MNEVLEMQKKAVPQEKKEDPNVRGGPVKDTQVTQKLEQCLTMLNTLAEDNKAATG